MSTTSRTIFILW